MCYILFLILLMCFDIETMYAVVEALNTTVWMWSIERESRRQFSFFVWYKKNKTILEWWKWKKNIKFCWECWRHV